MAAAREFVGLYEREAKAVLVFFARRTLDGELALDLTAETFAQAWQGWARVRSGSPEEVRGWLFMIARRQLSGYLRRGRVERRAVRRLGITTPAVHVDDLAQIDDAAGLGELGPRSRSSSRRWVRISAMRFDCGSLTSCPTALSLSAWACLRPRRARACRVVCEHWRARLSL
jgi:DNA-directed RNA polymerase specialized sigma24 family protein